MSGADKIVIRSCTKGLISPVDIYLKKDAEAQFTTRKRRFVRDLKTRTTQMGSNRKRGNSFHTVHLRLASKKIAYPKLSFQHTCARVC